LARAVLARENGVGKEQTTQVVADSCVEAALRPAGDGRLRLVEKLWDSLVEGRGDQAGVSPGIRAELDLRSAAHRRDLAVALNWASDPSWAPGPSENFIELIQWTIAGRMIGWARFLEMRSLKSRGLALQIPSW